MAALSGLGELERTMGLRATQDDDKASDVRHKASIVSRALEAWSGAKLRRGRQVRKRVAGKVVDVSDFQLVPVIGGAWEVLVV